jgi:hypothetical protein
MNGAAVVFQILEEPITDFFAGGLRISQERRVRSGFVMDPADWAALDQERSENLRKQLARGLAIRDQISENEAMDRLNRPLVGGGGPTLRTADPNSTPVWKLQNLADQPQSIWEFFWVGAGGRLY